MSVIAMTGVSRNASITQILKPLKSSIKGHFEVVNCIYNKNKNDRIVFLRLSEKLDPAEVVEAINSRKLGSLRAYVPEEIPDMVIVSITVILQEMQAKYSGLYDLSGVSAHKLLHDIARIIYKRLRKILQQEDDVAQMDSCLKLTKAYRKRYPHFGDFQMILATLHSIQDAEGLPRDQIHEADLTSFALQSHVIDNIPFDKVQNSYYKYLEKITATVMDHVKNLDMTPKNTSPEEIARIKIREQLKSLLPHLPACVKHATDHHFMPQESNVHTVYIYGEPSLPTKESLNPFLKRHKAVSTTRSNRIYNLMIVKVPKSEYLTLLEEDGTLVGSSKLVIRPSNLPYYEVPEFFIRSIQASYVKETKTEGANENWSSVTYY